MRTTIAGVTVFDGREALNGPFDVSFDESGITSLNPAGTAAPTEVIVDGSGATLLPGLIDSHVHFRDPIELSTLAQYGVTTALDMGSWPARFTAALRTAGYGADIRSAGTPLISPAGPHSQIPGFPADDKITTPEQARRRVAARIAEGVDHVKLVLERPGGGGLDLETAAAAVDTAHAAGLKVVAHASHTGAIALAVQAGVDIREPPADVPVTARDTSHGITQTALRAAAPAAAVLGNLDRLLSAPPYRLVAQHASTEAGLIARQGEHCPILASTPLLDTVKMARKTLRSLSSYGLDELLRYYGIPKPVQRHRAMPDVEVTAEVFRRLLEEGAAAGHWSTLLELDAAAGLQPRPRPHVPADVPVQDALFRPDVG